MDNSIIELDKYTINQIAAGEVIESPMSILKELLENSLDANSDELIIELIEGGIKSIKVIDNGIGIDSNQVEKAFLRHNTSKLSNIDDLYNLETMGFRGEALASIAAISKLNIKTTKKNKLVGVSLDLEGGEIVNKENISGNYGTSIEVADIFFNIPVRSKFLSGSIKEERKSIKVVQGLSLSRTDVKFKLYCDGKLVFESLGRKNLKDVFGNITSLDTAEKMYYFIEKGEVFSVEGLISNTDQYRGNRNYQYFYVNNRMIVSNNLGQVLSKAYKNTIPKGTYPFGVIKINIPTYEVEVNIHPTKLEVRIDREKELLEFLEGIIKKQLKEKSHENFAKKIDNSFLDKNYFENNINKDVKINSFIDKNKVDDIDYTYYYKEPTLKFKVDKELSNLDIREDSDKYKIKKTEVESIFSKLNPMSAFNFFGSISNTYIIGELEGELVIIDQHAAHERINYEKAKKEFEKSGFKSQFLLDPKVIEIGPEDYLKIIEHIIDINNYGVIIEEFGKNSFLIRALPLNIEGNEAGKAFIMNLIDKISSGEEEVKDYLISKAACVRSVKGNDLLIKNDILKLVERLGECDFPFSCPHGRPTVVKKNKHELEKMFLRS